MAELIYFISLYILHISFLRICWFHVFECLACVVCIYATFVSDALRSGDGVRSSMLHLAFLKLSETLWMKNNSGRSLFHLIASNLPSRDTEARTQGMKVEAGTESEPVEKSCSLTCSVCFLVQSITSFSREDTAHRALGPLTIINQENALEICLSASPMEGIPQMKFSLPRNSCLH